MSLYIVATPIGNLEDLSPRAVETLKKVDFILAEDTRVTKKLLSHFNIKTKTISYHQHSKIERLNKILNLLRKGNNLALVSDSGTPGISDPGNKLIAEISRELEIKIIPIPGPSALTSLASVSGFPMDKFLFLGFPPKKRKREKFFQKIKKSKIPVIVYESPHRITKTLKELPREREIVVGRELTKIHETIYRGKPEEVLNQLKEKGEFTIIINKGE